MDEVNERLARILDRTGDYRIHRRVPAPEATPTTESALAAAGLAVGIVLDTKADRLDGDEVTDFGAVRFAYEPSARRVDRVVGTFGVRRRPVVRVPSDVLAPAETVDDLASFSSGASVVIAHGAASARPVVERAWPWFSGLPWACSLTQVEWRSRDVGGRRLGALLADRRLFRVGRRALDDAVALLHLLRQPLGPAATGFDLLMREAARTTVRIGLVASAREDGAPLEARGYLSSGGGRREGSTWWRDVREEQVDEEISWLREHVHADAAPDLRRLTARDRFSTRADAGWSP